MTGAIQFSISMAYNDIDCDVKREKLGVYTNQVIIQHHDSVVTSSDLGLALHCQYDLGNKTVTNGLDLEVNGEIEPALVENGKVESPTVVMSVTARGGGRVERAQVGDPLELHFDILDQESPYEVFVRELIAKDGNDQNDIVLLDSNGCPTEGQIMGPLAKQKGNSKSLLANFDAFKFPTSEVVQFRALVTPCMPRCQPVECVYQDFYGGDNTRIISYGRKKRSAPSPLMAREESLHVWSGPAAASRVMSRRSLSTVEIGDDVLVTHSFQILDKFDRQRSRNQEKQPDQSSDSKSRHQNSFQTEDLKREKPRFTEKYSEEDSLSFSDEVFDPSNVEVCLNITALIAGVSVFLILQLVLVFVWTHFWQSRNRKKTGSSSSTTLR